MEFLHSSHAFANTPFNKIPGVRVRNKAAKDWKQFDHWKIGKRTYNQLCAEWREYNDFAVLPATQPEPTGLSSRTETATKACAT